MGSSIFEDGCYLGEKRKISVRSFTNNHADNKDRVATEARSLFQYLTPLTKKPLEYFSYFSSKSTYVP